MNLPRRTFLHLAACAAALSAGSRIARAQAYPSRPVRIIVGFAAGGNFDIVARVMAERMAERLGQPVIVENRPGASSNIATEAAIRSPADGYTLLLGGAVNAINATLYEKLNFNFAADLARCGRCPVSQCHDSERVVSGEVGPGVYRLRKDEPRQDQPWLIGHRHLTASCR